MESLEQTDASLRGWEEEGVERGGKGKRERERGREASADSVNRRNVLIRA